MATLVFVVGREVVVAVLALVLVEGGGFEEDVVAVVDVVGGLPDNPAAEYIWNVQSSSWSSTSTQSEYFYSSFNRIGIMTT